MSRPTPGGPDRRPRWGVTALCLAMVAGCTPRPQVPVVYPEMTPGTRLTLDVAWTRQITDVDNFVLRPDEFGAVSVDRDRQYVYVGTRDGRLMSLDARNGEVRWELPLGGPVSGTPTVAGIGDDRVLLVGTDNGVLVALDPDTGTTRWRYETEGRIRGPLIAVHDVVFFANSRDQIFALDGRNGQWRWQYPPDLRTIVSDFTIFGHAGLTYVPPADPLTGALGTLFACFDDGQVASLAASTGEAQWLSSVAPAEGGNFSDCDTTPVLSADGQTLYVAGQSTGVFALDPQEGAVRWSVPVRGVGALVDTPASGLVATSSLEGVFAFDESGRIRWRTQLDPGSLSAPAVLGDVLALGHAEAGLVLLDATTGDLMGRLGTGSGMSGTVTADAQTGRIYGISNRGVLLVAAVRGWGGRDETRIASATPSE